MKDVLLFRKNVIKMIDDSFPPVIVGDNDCLRNDYPSEIVISNISYPTLEHAYQAMKFVDTEIQKQIANSKTVREARKIGVSSKIRDNWDSIKLSVMNMLLRKKFSEDPILTDRLIKTGVAPIIMNGYDSFWGTGKDGLGENNFGKALADVRLEFQISKGFDFDQYKTCQKVNKDENEITNA